MLNIQEIIIWSYHLKFHQSSQWLINVRPNCYIDWEKWYNGQNINKILITIKNPKRIVDGWEIHMKMIISKRWYLVNIEHNRQKGKLGDFE